MYPYYREVNRLAPGDINSIRQLYAPRRHQTGTLRPGGAGGAR